MHGTSGKSPRPARAGAWRRGRRPYPAAIASAAALLAAIGAVGCSSPAAVPLSWSAARPPLPADASGVSNQYVVLNGVSCPGVGSCAAARLALGPFNRRASQLRKQGLEPGEHVGRNPGAMDVNANVSPGKIGITRR